MVNELPPFITEAEVKSRRFLAKDEPDYVTEAKVKQKSYTYCNFHYYITKIYLNFIYTYTLYYSKIHYIFRLILKQYLSRNPRFILFKISKN